ncbi:hypothetical protein [Mesorhizobium sp. SP-1A]|uniref:hypothetical protein n=1 Tax=Mesorhizobium sp. SP-1A TaxID=3077840 RepID=UPI0028F6D91B|nr:hypothetical protein [Mesorhizobium sp. SP-1A]
MNAHAKIEAAPTNAAVRAFELQSKMSNPLAELRDLNRVIMQFGTQEDAVPDERDRLAFLTLTSFVAGLLQNVDELREEIWLACYEAKFGHRPPRIEEPA